jgi:PKD repeat protein
MRFAGAAALTSALACVIGAFGAPTALAATASFEAAPLVVRAGQPVTLDGSLSSGAAPLDYSWSFGDGDFADSAEPRVTHVYSEPGVYTVELDVEDWDLDFATATRTVTVVDEFGASHGPWPREIARSGEVSAGLFYRGSGYPYRNVRLKIARNGVTALDVAFRKICRFCEVAPAGFGSRLSVRVRDLDADGEPEVVADLYTGGAHCCSYSRIYRWNADAGQYQGTTKRWNDAGYRLIAGRDGRPRFQTGDTRFAYAFASFAESFFPVRIFAFIDGHMRDVTRASASRRAVRRDAARIWRFYQRRRGSKRWNVRGALAAYMADKYSLGQSSDGWRRLRVALRRGDLRAQRLFGMKDVYPSGTRYLRVLRKRLARWAYRR